MADSVHMVLYTTYTNADFGPEPITTYAGPFASEEACEYWIEHNSEEYVEDLANYPEPTIQEHPVRTVEDLK